MASADERKAASIPSDVLLTTGGFGFQEPWLSLKQWMDHFCGFNFAALTHPFRASLLKLQVSRSRTHFEKTQSSLVISSASFFYIVTLHFFPTLSTCWFCSYTNQIKALRKPSYVHILCHRPLDKCFWRFSSHYDHFISTHSLHTTLCWTARSWCPLITFTKPLKMRDETPGDSENKHKPGSNFLSLTRKQKGFCSPVSFSDFYHINKCH